MLEAGREAVLKSMQGQPPMKAAQIRQLAVTVNQCAVSVPMNRTMFERVARSTPEIIRMAGNVYVLRGQEPERPASDGKYKWWEHFNRLNEAASKHDRLDKNN